MRRVLVATLAGAALLAGCGGDDESPPYEREMQVALAEFAAGVNALMQTVMTQDDEKSLEQLDRAAALLRSASDRVNALEPPPRARDPHGRLVSFFAAAAASLGGASDLAEQEGLRVGLNSVPTPLGGEAGGRRARLALEALQRQGFDLEPPDLPSGG